MRASVLLGRWRRGAWWGAWGEAFVNVAVGHRVKAKEGVIEGSGDSAVEGESRARERVG